MTSCVRAIRSTEDTRRCVKLGPSLVNMQRFDQSTPKTGPVTMGHEPIESRTFAHSWIAPFLMALSLLGAAATLAYAQDDPPAPVPESGVAVTLEALKDAVRRDPGDAAKRRELGHGYLRAGAAAAAEKEFTAAIRLGDQDPSLTLDLARALLLQGNFDRVLAMEPEVRSDPGGRARWLATRALALIGLGREGEAEALLVEASDLEPGEPNVYVARARLLVVGNESRAAEASVDRALERDPGHPEALLLKGKLRHLAGDAVGARAIFDRALVIDPRLGDVRLARAAVLIDLHDYDTARADLIAYGPEGYRTDIVSYLDALILFREGDFPGARRAFDRGAANLAREAPVGYLEAAIDEAIGDVEQATKKLNVLLTRFPGHVRARRLLGSLLLRHDDIDGTIEALLPLLEMSPNDGPALTLLATALSRAGAFDEATQLFERVMAQSPEDRARSNELATILASGGSVAGAMDNLETLGDVQGDDTESQMLLFFMHVREGRLADATATVERLRADLPDSPIPDNLEGVVRMAKGDLAGAKALFESVHGRFPDFAPASLNLAELDLAAGLLDEARQRLDDVLSRDPANTEASLRLAKVLVEQGKPVRARRVLEMAIGANPKAIEPRIALIDLVLAQGPIDLAVAVARETAVLFPDSDAATLAMGKVNMAAGDPDAAAESFRTLVRKNPNFAYGHLMLATALGQAGRTADAERAIARAESLAPDDPSVRAARIEFESQMGNLDAALDLVTRLHADQPDAPSVLLLRGDVLRRRGDYDEAIAAFDEALARTPSDEAALGRFHAQMEAGTPDEAIAFLEAWARDRPAGDGVWHTLAETYLALGRYPLAIETYEAIVARRPGDAAALNNLAWLYQEVGDGRAVATARQAVAAAPDVAAFADTLGWILVRQGKPERGIEALERALGLAPDDPTYRWHMAKALADAGRIDVACRRLAGLREEPLEPALAEPVEQEFRALGCP